MLQENCVLEREQTFKLRSFDIFGEISSRLSLFSFSKKVLKTCLFKGWIAPLPHESNLYLQSVPGY